MRERKKARFEDSTQASLKTEVAVSKCIQAASRNEKIKKKDSSLQPLEGKYANTEILVPYD